MKKLNLFKKIFIKNLKKGNEPLSKFADDIGELKGIFSFKQYDLNNKLLNCEQFDNMIVNQSKSSIIRLLGQVNTPYRIGTAINPENYKISKMRFSNESSPSIDVLNYYSIAEPSSRIVNVTDNYPGGQNTPGNNILTPSNTTFPHTFSIQKNNDPTGWETVYPQGKVFQIKGNPAVAGERPPSHGSVKVKLYKNFSGTHKIIEEIDFTFVTEVSPQTKRIYTRNNFNNIAYVIRNPLVEGNYHHVTTPVHDDAVKVESLKDDPNNPGTDVMTRTTSVKSAGSGSTGTRVFYDATINNYGWKIFLETLGDISIPTGYTTTILSQNNWSKVQIDFNLGYDNVINSIIPKIGYNNGFGTSNITRYNSDTADFYTVTSASYEDSATHFIDDYAVTFTTLMNPTEGNGQASGVNVIKYKKAFLFSENNDIFSAIMFPTDNFQKNANSAFVISWKILAPVE